LSKELVRYLSETVHILVDNQNAGNLGVLRVRWRHSSTNQYRRNLGVSRFVVKLSDTFARKRVRLIKCDVLKQCHTRQLQINRTSVHFILQQFGSDIERKIRDGVGNVRNRAMTRNNNNVSSKCRSIFRSECRCVCELVDPSFECAVGVVRRFDCTDVSQHALELSALSLCELTKQRNCVFTLRERVCVFHLRTIDYVHRKTGHELCGFYQSVVKLIVRSWLLCVLEHEAANIALLECILLLDRQSQSLAGERQLDVRELFDYPVVDEYIHSFVAGLNNLQFEVSSPSWFSSPRDFEFTRGHRTVVLSVDKCFWFWISISFLTSDLNTLLSNSHNYRDNLPTAGFSNYRCVQSKLGTCAKHARKHVAGNYEVRLVEEYWCSICELIGIVRCENQLLRQAVVECWNLRLNRNVLNYSWQVWIQPEICHVQMPPLYN